MSELTYDVNAMSDMQLRIAVLEIIGTLAETQSIRPANYDAVPDDIHTSIDCAERIVKAWNRYIMSTGSGIGYENELRRLCSYYLAIR